MRFLKVIIPLAGAGTRLRPLTHTKPKPMLLIAGKPGMCYILDELKKMDVSEVIFITGHLKERIEDFIRQNYSFRTRFIEQRELNGTAGAIRLTEKYINEPVLIIFVDTIFETDLSIINKLQKDEAGIIWTKHVEDYQRFGVCVLDNQGYLQKIVEKPSQPISKLANIGLYYIKDYKLLFKGIKYVFDHNITLKGEYFLTDAFDYMVRQGAKILCPEVKGWYDFGKPETLLETNRTFLDKGYTRVVNTENSVINMPVNIAEGAKIKDSVVGPYVTIAKDVEITNSVVKDSIIEERTRITDSSIEDSIIGSDAEITGHLKKLYVGDHSVIITEKFKSFNPKKQGRKEGRKKRR